MPAPQRRTGQRWLKIAGVVAVLFGLLTIWEGGSVLFLDGAEPDRKDNYVPFVVQFNFIAGFAYVVAGIGLWFGRAWAPWLALVILVATLIVFAAFGVHVARGGAYEIRTVIAMTLRAAVWAAIAGLAYRTNTGRTGAG